MEIKNVHCEKQALELFRMMPDNKKSALHNALSRNLEFTTSWGLELGELRAYENGVYSEAACCSMLEISTNSKN